MKRPLLIYLIAALLCISCTKDRIIPSDTMSDIYYDLYMTDRIIQDEHTFRKIADTSRIYEPIFNKYGYTTQDYYQSVNYWLEHPDKFVKIFKKTQQKLEDRKSFLEKAIAAEEFMGRKWGLIDSLKFYAYDSLTANPYYRSLKMLFFKPDTILADSPQIDSSRYDIKTSPFMLFDGDPFYADSLLKNSPRIPDFILHPDTLDLTGITDPIIVGNEVLKKKGFFPKSSSTKKPRTDQRPKRVMNNLEK